MMSRFLQGVELNSWILAITPIFFLAFLALVVWVYWGSRKKHYEEMGQMPLKSEAQDKLLSHDSDGIQEYDNDLPKWWLYLFYFTIVWAGVYVVYFHFTGHLSQRAQLDQELAQQKLAPPIAGTDEKQDWGVLTADAARRERGKAIWVGKCVACHGAEGQGGIGPNLTDNYWLHGGSPAKIVKTITDGVPEKGMLPWKTLLKKEEILDATVFVLSLKGTQPPNPKAPQGELEK